MKVILTIENWITIEKEVEVDMEYLPSEGDLIIYKDVWYKIRSRVFNVNTKSVKLNIREV